MKIRLLVVAIVLAAGCAKSEPPVSKPGPARPDYVISYDAAVSPTENANLETDKAAIPPTGKGK